MSTGTIAIGCGTYPQTRLVPRRDVPVVVYYDALDGDLHGANKIAAMRCTLAGRCAGAESMNVSRGGAGFGRDPSVSFAHGNTTYVSFLEYSAVGRMRAHLAILQGPRATTQQSDREVEELGSNMNGMAGHASEHQISWA